MNHPDGLVAMDAHFNKLKGNVFEINVGLPRARVQSKAAEAVNAYGMVMQFIQHDDFVRAFRSTHQRLYNMFRDLDQILGACDQPDDTNGNPSPAAGVNIQWAEVYSSWMLS
jgi:hypothetical protein